MRFPHPHCIFGIKLGGGGQFSPKIREFYHHLCLLAEIAIRDTGVPIICFSPEEEAKLLGVSPTTVRNWIEYLIDNGWLFAINREGGRGKKATFRLNIKTQQQKAVEYRDYSTTPFGQPATAPHEPQKPTPSPEKTPPPPPNGPKEPPASRKKLSPTEQRAEKLRKLLDDTLVQGKIFNWVIEQFRHCCWKMGFTRSESDIVCNAIGRLIKGKPLGEARKLARWFWKQTRSVLEKLREAAKRGLRAAYAMLGYLFRKALGILNPPSKERKKPASPPQKTWRWDLNDPQERKIFLDRVENIIQEGGGRCPRCGNVLRVEYWETNAGLAFQDRDGCRCLYIALDRDARYREKQYQLQKQARAAQPRPPSPRGLANTLGDLLKGLLGGGEAPPPDPDPKDPERDRLAALEDPEEIRRIIAESLPHAGLSPNRSSATIRGP